MKKAIILVALFAALGTTTSQAQYRQDQTVWGSNDQRSNDRNVYSDDRGEYRYETRERRVWVPEYRTGGIFGVGGRRVPGHYEMRNERVKVYTRQNDQNRKQHPHGMPPGQRKKYDNRYDDRNRNDGRYDERNRTDGRYEDRSRDQRDDDRYRQSKGHGKKNNDRD